MIAWACTSVGCAPMLMRLQAVFVARPPFSFVFAGPRLVFAAHASFSPVWPPFSAPTSSFRPAFGAFFDSLGVIFVQNRRKSRRETVSTPRERHLGRAGPPTRTAVSPSCWLQPTPATLWARWPPLIGRILPRSWSAKGEGLRRESGQLRDHSPCISAIAASKRSRARSTGPRLAAGIHGSAR